MAPMARRRLLEIVLDPQVVTLAAVLSILTVAIYLFGPQLTPFAIALIFAFHLEAGVQHLIKRGLQRGWSVTVVFGLFLIAYIGAVAGPLQLILRRSLVLAGQIPERSDDIADLLRSLFEPIVDILPPGRQEEFIGFLLEQADGSLDYIVTQSITWIPQFTSWMVYLFLIPLLVFFFLKDKKMLVAGIVRCLPRDRELVEQIWKEMVVKMGNYIRGKIWEILIVAVATWMVLALLGFQYPAVMGLVSGISVLIPYVGAIGVAVPVFVLGYLQWGMGWDLGWVMIAYTAIQMIDGNILVPYIFSEAVKLHPVLILLSVFLFGSLWGVLGVFFAIPLATLVKSLVLTILDFRERRTA